MAIRKNRRELRQDTLTAGERIQGKDTQELLTLYEDVRRAKLEGSPTELRIAELHRDIFESEHDFTGARIGELFTDEVGSRLRSRFESHPDLEPAAEDDRSQYLIVAMNELERINKEGGHTGGDRLLAQTSAAIERTVASYYEERGVSEGYEIYRFSGNEFAVVLDGLTAHDRKELRKALLDPSLRPSSEGIAPAPLSVVGLGMSDVIGTLRDFHAYRHSIGEQEGSDAQVSVTDALTVLKGVLREEMRQEQLFDLITRLHQSSLEDRALAEDRFSLYGRKYFSETDIRTFTDLERAVPGWGEESLRDFAAEVASGIGGRERHQERLYESIVQNRAVQTARGRAESKRKLPPPASAGVTTGARLLLSNAQHINESADDRERERAMLELRYEQIRRDRLTGLLNRREFFGHQERRLREGITGGCVYIDMAFLKYFNTGGKALGNRAIQRSAELLEAAVTAAKVRAQVYRLGGDEFGIVFEGNGSDEEKVRSVLYSISGTERMEHPEAAPSYIPEALHFNFGSATDDVARQVLDDLCKTNAVVADRCASHETRREALVQVQTMLADTELEYLKQQQRIRLLIEKIRSKDPAAESLMTFSGKALASPEIAQRIREIAAGNLKGADLTEAIRDLSEWAWSYSQSETAARATALEIIITSRVRETLLSRELQETRARLAELSAQYDAEHALVERSRSRILELEKQLTAHQEQHLRYLASNDR